MASSSRSAYRFLSTSAVRAEVPGTNYSPPRGMKSNIQPFIRNIIGREDLAKAAAGQAALNAIAAESAPVEIEGRKRIDQHRFLSPDQMTRTSLYAPDPPRTRAPLLGPRNREARKIDPFHITRTSPLDHVYNPLMGQAFVNQMGWIKSRAETGLTWKSQRAVGKLARRQRAMGIIGQWTSRPTAGGLGSERTSRYD
ncbi:uncharacterized protein MKK02DRAFT_39497 [Dioszegia hungarica]|uniref:Small ribosomal subunit protein bS18m n=1 Tax=Dioszegia hungarica TaxID=4972 RepID=A0AA38HGN8_9TREE|nr:uncharacterized protein MKK02DRAFT_39497 [Dioszegia hungarica]KAI9639206.1 hypothetical protein MKK02DRAFT_39497 [Dioszegia hungarica]